MPKSKRDKIVHLTKVKKKTKEHKEDLLKQVEGYAKQYKNVFIFDFDATQSDRIMNLRVKLKGNGRIFAGKNSIASAALRTLGEKTKIDHTSLIRQITGHRGLLFSDMEYKALSEFLQSESPEFLDKLLCYSSLTASLSKSKLRVVTVNRAK